MTVAKRKPRKLRRKKHYSEEEYADAAQAIQDLIQHIVYVLPVLHDEDRDMGYTVLLRRKRRMYRNATKTVERQAERIAGLEEDTAHLRELLAKQEESSRAHYIPIIETLQDLSDKGQTTVIGLCEENDKLSASKSKAEKTLAKIAKLTQPLVQPELDEYKARAKDAEERLDKLLQAFRRDSMSLVKGESEDA
mgnify:FL=1|tara:strand:- start:791 stop:1369 length:579 start_codon:yes stop_codon:yes gene_type:complete